MLLFIILNILDCISTFIGIKLGLSEGNFLLGQIFNINIWLGLAVKMLLVFIILLALKFLKKLNLLKIINYILSAIVVFNTLYIIVSLIIYLVI